MTTYILHTKFICFEKRRSRLKLLKAFIDNTILECKVLLKIKINLQTFFKQMYFNNFVEDVSSKEHKNRKFVIKYGCACFFQMEFHFLRCIETKSSKRHHPYIYIYIYIHMQSVASE